MLRRDSQLLSVKAECVSGVDVIMHVASPLPNSSTPQVILDVRSARAQIQLYVL